MSGEGGEDGDGNASDSGWPVDLDGVVESVAATLGPNDRWNFAALGLFPDEPVTARTWGNTRTRRNFHREGEGYVQFTRDPVAFVEAACSIHERDDPVLPSADAWVRVEVGRVEMGESGGTQWERWALTPVESGVERRVVPTISRGRGAVIEGAVAASRLDVPSYDTADLLDRLAYFEGVVERCGSERDRVAFDRLTEHSGWKRRNESF
ncbi:DUF447 domain-containing protein [Halalkalicoccus subterraneus]|uniref:DUF447 domain-containing protein n=1 Tax=Halalkalicoccus subterraneus TaxID=2675002 RepID=UPI000EFB63E8|nr:DUF447 domain-containing protein [Halalkalicoccus subterraneus]